MSKKSETLFSNQLIKNLNQVFWTRIENKHGGGVPDLYGTYNNKSAFLELKIKTKQNKLLISPLQISWNYKHFSHNPINYYLVNDPRHKIIELYDGNKGRELLENCNNVTATLTFSTDNWHLLTGYLFSWPRRNYHLPYLVSWPWRFAFNLLHIGQCDISSQPRPSGAFFLDTISRGLATLALLHLGGSLRSPQYIVPLTVAQVPYVVAQHLVASLRSAYYI